MRRILTILESAFYSEFLHRGNGIDRFIQNGFLMLNNTHTSNFQDEGTSNTKFMQAVGPDQYKSEEQQLREENITVNGGNSNELIHVQVCPW